MWANPFLDAGYCVPSAFCVWKDTPVYICQTSGDFAATPFLQDPYFLFMVSSNSVGSGIACGEEKKKKKKNLISAPLISLPKLACITL